MSDELVTVYHPHLTPGEAGSAREVAKDDLSAWVEQGWLKSEPKASSGAKAEAK